MLFLPIPSNHRVWSRFNFQLRLAHFPVDFRLPNIPPQKLVQSSTTRPGESPRPRRRVGKFLRGPIPWWWITRASALGGKTPLVAVAIWFFVGVKKSDTIRLSSGFLERELGVGRMSAYRALSRLEEAKLIGVNRRRGRNPMVEVIREEAGEAERIVE